MLDENAMKKMMMATIKFMHQIIAIVFSLLNLVNEHFIKMFPSHPGFGATLNLLIPRKGMLHIQHKLFLTQAALVKATTSRS